MRNGRLGKIEHRMDIDLERALPFVITDIRNILERGLVGRIVDEDIDPAQLIDGPLTARQ